MTKIVTRRKVPDKVTKPGGDLAAWLDATKAPSRLIAPIERHLLTRPPDDRRTDVLHPSEIIAADWCHRASYHLLNGETPKPQRHRLRMQTVFDEGHTIHRKWQSWLAEMGKLYGLWTCLQCGWKGWELAPIWCPRCTAGQHLVYSEVPLVAPRHRIHGHADGWVKDLGDDCLIEIKSIGLGTVRMEAPALLAKADGDVEKLWGSIRRPFGKHLRQGQMYLALAHIQDPEDAPEEIVFLYENKMNQAAKEFVVAYDPEVSHDVLEAALDLDWALRQGNEPDCNVADKNCPQCKAYDK